MAILVEENKMAIHEVVNEFVLPLVWLQVAGTDVAIPYLQGDPGCGKTACLNKMCEDNKFNLFHCRFSMIPIEDISGIPQIVELSEDASALAGTTGKVYGTNWTMPELVSDIYEAAKDGRPTVVFLDDFHLCSPSHTQYGFDLFSEHKLRQYQMPKNVAFVLAGNTSTKSGAKQLLAAVGNRCQLLPAYMDFEQWKKNFAIPHRVNSKVLSFLSRSSNTKFCHEEEVMNQAWGSFRAWTRFAEWVTAKESLLKQGETISNSLILYGASGSIGGEGAAAFASYYNLFSEIDTDAIFNKGAKIEVPSEADKLYIFCMACCSELYNGFYERFTKENKKFPLEAYYTKIAEVIIEVSKQSRDMSIVTLRDIMDNSKCFNRGNNPALKIYKEIEKISPEMFDDITKRLNEYFK